VIFEAKRFVSNGRVPDLTHIVYVDPEGYAALPDAASLRRVGQAVGAMNKLLRNASSSSWDRAMGESRRPPARGSRRVLGHPHAAALIEVARRRGAYVPDLSFGTHFFQDLVEASIPLPAALSGRPRNPLPRGVPQGLASMLGELAPEFRDLEAVVRVIDVPKVTGGSS